MPSYVYPAILEQRSRHHRLPPYLLVLASIAFERRQNGQGDHRLMSVFHLKWWSGEERNSSEDIPVLVFPSDLTNIQSTTTMKGHLASRQI